MPEVSLVIDKTKTPGRFVFSRSKLGLAVNGMLVWAAMLHPGDDNQQEIMRVVQAVESEDFVADDIPREWGRLLVNQQGRTPKQQRAGMTAGWILLYVLRCVKHHPGWAGLGTARELVRLDLTALNSAQGERFNLHPESIKKAWGQMKQVAHLWGAWLFLDMGKQDWNDRQDFLQFLALAEHFRRQGESHCPPLGNPPSSGPVGNRSPTPLLDPEATYKVGCFLRLPRVHSELDPLPADLYEHLAARKRRS